MIRYNFSTIKGYTNNDFKKILNYFKYVLYLNSNEFILNNEYAKKILASKSYKDSYLLNLEGFINNINNNTDSERFVYLDLASKRDVFNYYNTKGKENFLYYWVVKDLYNIDQLKNNSSLIIENYKIYFIYEGD